LRFIIQLKVKDEKDDVHFVVLTTSATVQAQPDSLNISKDTTFTLIEDSLFTNTGQLIVVGQRFTCRRSSRNKWLV
jgi:hypothetical protein